MENKEKMENKKKLIYILRQDAFMSSSAGIKFPQWLKLTTNLVEMFYENGGTDEELTKIFLEGEKMSRRIIEESED